MILHANAALSRRQRERLVGLVFAGVTITSAAAVVGCSRQTASKWVGRWRRGEGLTDRSSRPHRSPRQTSAAVERAVLQARAELRAGPHPVGWAVGVAASTVHAILRRHGCSRLVERPCREEIIRYERERLGELLHIDCKKLGLIIAPGHRVTGDRSKRARSKAGWIYLYAAVDDASRLGFARVYPDETAASAISFLEACIRFYARHGITIERVLTDNGTCFKRRWREACDHHQIAVRKTRPYRPQTNGKAERFIRTLLETWAYAYPYQHERDRQHALPAALDSYNRFRRHRALEGQTPLQRVNNLSGTNT
ncbi:MAG TPA: IS481 family transposase [Solirubrobacterales bacterium]|nr:IS481 family transposase [Solirubrobacterales bacterium]